MREGSGDVTIVIPQHNHTELTLDCIRSIRACERTLWPIVVVDDGSSPENREVILSNGFLETRVVFQTQKGVSAAWNHGAGAAATEYLLFLNNDVLFLDEVIELLIAPLRNGSEKISGVTLREEKRLPAEMLNRCPAVCFLEGWCFAVSAKTFRQLNGFDEAMRLYWSDTDLQMRLVERFGKAGMVSIPELPLKHLGHRTTRSIPRRRDFWYRDREVFLAKWRDRC